MLSDSDEDTGGGGALVPTESLCCNEKFSPKGVGFCASSHPQSGCRVPACRVRPMEGFPLVIIPWGGGKHSSKGCQTTSNEAGWPGAA